MFNQGKYIYLLKHITFLNGKSFQNSFFELFIEYMLYYGHPTVQQNIRTSYSCPVITQHLLNNLSLCCSPLLFTVSGNHQFTCNCGEISLSRFHICVKSWGTCLSVLGSIGFLFLPMAIQLF